MQKLWWLLTAAVVLAVFGASPFDPVDIAKLAPVQTMVISRVGGQVRVDCGEELAGQGDDLEQALEDLTAGASDEVFLATAQQIVVVGDDGLWTQLLRQDGLRPAARLYQTASAPKAEDITAYLLRDKTTATLLELRIAREYGRELTVPVLAQTEGGYRLVSGKPI